MLVYVHHAQYSICFPSLDRWKHILLESHALDSINNKRIVNVNPTIEMASLITLIPSSRPTAQQ
jgi:hypothetical protein